MFWWDIVRITVWVVGLPIIAYLVWRIVLRVRDINQLDAQVRKEEEEMAKNPYAAYARMLEAQQLLDEARGKRKPDRKDR